ncbi:MAG: methyltransferase domain-containing protein [Pseudomonadota bacterium]
MNIPLSLKQTLPYRIARRAYHFPRSAQFRRWRLHWRRGANAKLLTNYLASHEVAKLQIGSGSNARAGWLNSDYLPEDSSQFHLDATAAFEIPGGSFDMIFSEHMIEHISFQHGAAMLRECFRVMKPGGRIRISTPPMDFVIDLLRNPTQEHQRYIDWHMENWLPDLHHACAAVVANDFVRNWGHLFIYDESTLRHSLQQAGFVQIQRKALDESGIPELRGLENVDRMPAGLLELATMTLEAEKP